MVGAISIVATAVPLPNKCRANSGSRKPHKPRNSLDITVLSLCNSGQLDEAIRLVEGSSSSTSVDTYAHLLHSCITHKSLHHGRRLYRRFLHSDESLFHDATVISKFITLFSVSGSLDEAQKVFEDELMFDEGLDESVWVAMGIGYSKNGCFNHALSLYINMLCRGVRPGSFALSMALNACLKLREYRFARGIHAQVVKCREAADQIVYNCLMELYSQCGSFDEPLKLFDKMPYRNVVTWNSLIAGFVREGLIIEALNVFRMMQKDMIGFSWITLTTVLPICATGTMLKYGKEIHAQIIKAKKWPDILVLNALIDMYMKCGILDHGKALFSQMQLKDITSWNVALAGYAFNGCMEEAMALFKEMISLGEKPDSVTFVIMLSGCSHSGLVHPGKKLFTEMKAEYGIPPRLEHYACMVDLLGRKGRIDEALDMVTKMPMKPTGSIWGSLLNSCRLHGNIILGQIVANKLFELEPYNSGNYVLLSNIYAKAGIWDKVNEVRNLMQKRGIKKDAGCSWVQIKSEIHTFVSGGALEFQNSPQYKELETHLGNSMKKLGYAPDTRFVLHDINEEMKESLLNGHSERLATMFALINTCDGVPIRITKNLRVCIDCHSWMKSVSFVTGRTITLRDSARFHHFKDGACSCKDYW